MKEVFNVKFNQINRLVRNDEIYADIILFDCNYCKLYSNLPNIIWIRIFISVLVYYI